MSADPTTTQYHADAQPTPAATEAPTILVVDDEGAILDMLSQALEWEGYNVVLARDGLDAMQRVEEACPDLVVSDVMMPVLDGGNLATIMHSRESTRGVPVVGITALARLRRATDSYFDAVLPKPLDLDQLFRVIARLLGEKREPRRVLS